MQLYNLLGKILIVTKDRRPEGFQFAFNQLEIWSNQILNEVNSKGRLPAIDLLAWRLFCPEEYYNYRQAYQFQYDLALDSVLNTDIRASEVTWNDPDSLLNTVQYFRDNWNRISTACEKFDSY